MHTPAALARFTLRRVERALRAMGLSGVADPSVTLVDPACGPGVFLAAAVDEAGLGAPAEVLGFDIDEAAIRVAKQQLQPALATRGWPLTLSARNTLAAPLEVSPERTLVVVGNPPWAGRSANPGIEYTADLLADFRRMPDGSPLGERKVGVLSDDYVRFVRWGAEQARHHKRAVLALLTNASYLDGPVHRAMRAALRGWFEHLELVDLGGSALVAKRRGALDTNVFGVRPGAALLVASRGASGPARVTYSRVRGDLDDKLRQLEGDGPSQTPIEPRPPLHRFVPGPPPDERYASWPSVAELFVFHREGIQTNRDALCYAPDAATLRARLAAFAAGRLSPGRSGKASRHYDPQRARAAARQLLAQRQSITRVAYRPGDSRAAALAQHLCHRPRPALLQAMAQSSVALLTVRKDRGERPWAHFGLSALPVDNCYLSSRSSCRTRAFPSHQPDGSPNVHKEMAAQLAPRAGSAGSEEWVYYAAAVLASQAYRERYGAHLAADYPRLPPAADPAHFVAAASAGRALHAALEAADTPSGDETAIGHRTVRSARLASAIDACTSAVAALID